MTKENLKLKTAAEPVDAWDSGELGRSAAHVERASPEMEKEVMSSLGLQAVSLRLPQQLITDLKFIADYRSIGYQPMMRDVLLRWVRLEMSQIAHELKERVEVNATIEAAGMPNRKTACG
jgi:hypothetical protein